MAEADAVTEGLGVTDGFTVGWGFFVGFTVADGVEVGCASVGEGDMNITFIVDSLGKGEIRDLFRNEKKYITLPATKRSTAATKSILILFEPDSISLIINSDGNKSKFYRPGQKLRPSF